MGTLKDDRKYWETYNGGIAFFKYKVKAVWFMFAVLKNWVVLFLQLRKIYKKCIEYSRKWSISIAYFKLDQWELCEIQKDNNLFPKLFLCWIMQPEFVEGENNLPYSDCS